jgi:Replication-relaxation
MSPLGSPLASNQPGPNPHKTGGSCSQVPMQQVRPTVRSSSRLIVTTRERLSTRDLEVLRLIGRLRMMSGAQLRELYWPEGNPATRARLARRGLARLVALEVLTPLSRRIGGVRGGSAGTVYALGKIGQGILASERGSKKRARPAYTPGERFLAHTVALSQLYVELVAATRWGLADLLSYDPEPDCWVTYPAPFGAKRTLKPDAFVRLGIGDYEDVWFIERDMGTIAAVTIERQAHRYLECYRTGIIQGERGVFPRTVWIVPDQARAGVVTEALGRLPGEARKLFAVTTASEAIALLTAGDRS